MNVHCHITTLPFGALAPTKMNKTEITVPCYSNILQAMGLVNNLCTRSDHMKDMLS